MNVVLLSKCGSVPDGVEEELISNRVVEFRDVEVI